MISTKCENSKIILYLTMGHNVISEKSTENNLLSIWSLDHSFLLYMIGKKLYGKPKSTTFGLIATFSFDGNSRNFNNQIFNLYVNILSSPICGAGNRKTQFHDVLFQKYFQIFICHNFNITHYLRDRTTGNRRAIGPFLLCSHSPINAIFSNSHQLLAIDNIVHTVQGSF